MYFPVTCVDNFFNDPDSIRQFALSLDYHKVSDGRWPGLRTDNLSLIAPSFYHTFCQKLFSLTYNVKKEPLQADLILQFALIDPKELTINQGWVHQDGCRYAGIVYLNPNISTDSGTSIFKKINYVYDDSNGEIKQRLYLGSKDPGDLEGLEEHNSNFQNTIKFGNVYNRLIAFDANQYHSIDSFGSNNDDPRLTIVFFANEIQAARFPVPDCKTFYL